MISGRGVGFDPSFRQVKGALWLRGDSLVSSGGLITSWADKYGNFASGTATSTISPAITSVNPFFGGRATSTWIASQAQLITMASFSVSQPNTVYVVYRQSITGNANMSDGLSDRQVAGAGPTWNTYYAGSALDSPIAQDKKVHVMCAVVNNTNSAIYIDQSGAPTFGTAGTRNISSGLLIGASNGLSGQGATGMTGDIAEYLIYPGADSAIQVKAFFTYGSWYYSLPGVA